MSLGERIRFFRKKKKWTQVELGEKMGFTGTTANIRVAQYEWNRRKPSWDTVEKFAEIFDVVPEALQNPDIDSKVGLMHTLFTLEDLYGITVTVLEGRVCLKPDVHHPKFSPELADDLAAWSDMKNKLDSGSITKDEYDHWRYHYPKDREDAEKHRGTYNLVEAQSGTIELKEDSAVYSEDDVLEILKLYKEKHK